MTTRRPRTILLKTWMWIIILALYVPLGAMILMSFNQSRFGIFPFKFSLDWYEHLGPDNPLIAATVTSLQLALYVTVTCAVIGTGLGIWLSSSGLRRLRVSVNASLLATVTIPLLILSVAILEIVNILGLGQSALSLWLACSVVSLPYMVFVVTARLQSLDPALVRASRSLGSGPVRTFWRVTLPLIRTSIIAGSLMAFVVCFNNFTIQLFISPIGVQTLPVNIYAQTRVGITPDINAVASIIVVAMFILVIVLQLVSGSAARIVTGQGKDKANG